MGRTPSQKRLTGWLLIGMLFELLDMSYEAVLAQPTPWITDAIEVLIFFSYVAKSAICGCGPKNPLDNDKKTRLEPCGTKFGISNPVPSRGHITGRYTSPTQQDGGWSSDGSHGIITKYLPDGEAEFSLFGWIQPVRHKHRFGRQSGMVDKLQAPRALRTNIIRAQFWELWKVYQSSTKWRHRVVFCWKK